MTDRTPSTILPSALDERTPTPRLLGAAIAVLAVAVVSSTCATNPATGERQLVLIGTQEEIRMGRQTAEQVESTMGLYDHEGLDGYVEEIGLEMARSTERPDLPWSFDIADEAVVNAFALPGGFIYLTRGILAHFNSEAEMAAVLGHEIGHVTARHSVEQMSQQQLAQLGLGLGSVLFEGAGTITDVVGAGLGVLFLKFSREDERQADELGFRYMLSQGFDPREMADVFEMFRRQSEASGGSGVPNWLSTHPTPTSRIEAIRARVDSLPAGRLEGTRTEREGFLRRLEGMVYGPDPRHGFFQDRRFVHPELEVRVDFPEGWQVRNMARMVAGVSPEQDAQVRLTLADASSRHRAAENFVENQGVETVGSEERSVHGFPALVVRFRARGESGILQGVAAFLEDGSRVYSLLGVTPEARFGRWEPTFRAFIGSFDRLTDPEALAVQPLRVELITPERETTIARLAAERDGPLSADELALLNGLEADQQIPAGRTIKWIAGELPEAMRTGGR